MENWWKATLMWLKTSLEANEQNNLYTKSC